MAELSRLSSEGWMNNGKVRIAERAAQQFGRVSRAQMLAKGVSQARIARWLSEGYIFHTLPGVYAVGHRAPSVEGDLSDALLYAGEGAMLSHVTALWWLGLLEHRPRVIHISTPGRRLSRRGLRVHQQRRIARVFHKGLPITPVAQALLDYAATARLNEVRYILAQAEYDELLHLAEVRETVGRGRAGSTRLRVALRRHEPRLAHTRSRVERKFFFRCEESGLPLPEMNAKLGRQTVDAMWWKERVAVELDGGRGHTTKAQMERDRRRDLKKRALGFTPLRYCEDQIDNYWDEVLADLKLALGLAA
jgi:predicted transcriptional regulator of viral defense system